MTELPSCYFAHHVTDYNTLREQEAISTIERHGLVVVNPNDPAHEIAYKEHGMAYFLGLVATCDTLAFQRFSSGEVGAGVGKEIAAALEHTLPVFEIVDDQLVELDDVEVNSVIDSALSVDATRALIAHIRAAPA